jgi:hyperosmotically inducible periplasmic protein
MKSITIKKMQTPKVLGLVLCLGAMPLVSMVTGCAGDRYHQSTGEAIDDEGISRHVRSALADDLQYKYDGVSVKTFKGTVQLSGFVNTSAQKDRAETLAKGVQGVKEVENGITVKE